MIILKQCGDIGLASILDNVYLGTYGWMPTFESAITLTDEPATEFRIDSQFLRKKEIDIPFLKVGDFANALSVGSQSLDAPPYISISIFEKKYLNDQ